jgi:uncharacterized membrane protein
MTIALGYVFLLSWALWIGAIVFFIFIVAPTAFRSLEVEHAGKFIRTVFPRYYLTGLVCGLFGLVSGGLLIATRYWPWKSGTTVLVLVFGMMVVVFWARQRLLPHMDALRDEAHEARVNDDHDAREDVLRRWQRLHRLSVWLNLLVLLLGLATGWAWLSCWLVLPGRW